MNIEAAKKLAGRAAVDNHVRHGMKVGIGSGSTIVYAVERLAERIDAHELHGIIAVCTSLQSSLLCREKGIKVSTLDDNRIDGILDVAIDGADEVDEKLNLIKGGGGAHAQEKIVDGCAKEFIVVVDEKKVSGHLGERWAVPVEVIPMAMAPVTKRLASMGATPVLRMAVKKMGPVVTDNGNIIIDANFGIIDDPAGLEAKINNIPGVVENGIFANMTAVVYVGRENGTLDVKKRPGQK